MIKNIAKEQIILNIIKYGPIIFVLVLSLIVTKVILEDKKKNFEQDIKNLEETFLLNNKKRVKEEVQEVYNYILNEKLQSEKLLRETLKDRVYEAHNVAYNIYKNESHESAYGHAHSNDHILQSIKNALGGMIYNKGRGYIFIDGADGTKILQPLNKEFEGKNLLAFEDAKGYRFVEKIASTIKNKTEAYDSYYWYKAGDRKNAYKKTSFYKYFEPLNVAIGTGEYLEDFENELKKKVLDRIKQIRYADNGYIFLYDTKGDTLSHYKQSLIGTNRFNYQDKEGRFLVQDVINFAQKNQEGYIAYNATIKPSKTIRHNAKISYLKLFKDWNWVIGTGFYTDSLEKQIAQKKLELTKSNKEYLESIVYYSILLTFVFILFSFYVSRHIKSRFDDYKKSLRIEVEKTIEKEKQLIQQSKMAVMGEMIGNIAHQWKQPLSTISMSNSLLSLKLEVNNSLSQDDAKETLQNIDTAVNHLNTTIDDFRNFFKPNKEKEYFKITKVFEKTDNLISAQLSSFNIKVLKNIQDIEIHAYQNELLQVIINILKNAEDELIKIDKNKRVIFIDAYSNKTDIIIRIKDNAGGIPKEIIHNIFDSYFTTKEDSKGTGIGLYMSKQIVENMDGTIEVQNSHFSYEEIEYDGAEFVIKIPIK